MLGAQRMWRVRRLERCTAREEFSEASSSVRALDATGASVARGRKGRVLSNSSQGMGKFLARHETTQERSWERTWPPVAVQF